MNQLVLRALFICISFGIGSFGVATASDIGIAVEKPWARATVLKDRPGAAYLTLRNKLTKPDRLLSVKSSAASHIAVHSTEMKDGIMKMSSVPVLSIGAGETVALKPGGSHLMLMGLQKKLIKGETFKITLQFENAGKIDVEIPILSLGSKGPE